MSNRNYPAAVTAASILDSFFNDPFFSIGFSDIPTKVTNSICSSNYPKSDIYRTEDGALHIECAVAGYTEDEIQCDYKDNYITVTLKKEQSTEKRKYLQGGIKYSREASDISFYIDPTYFNADKATVDLKNGIFSIMVPCNEKLAKNRVLFGKKEEPKQIANAKDAEDVEATEKDSE